jgi:hypothetical protein
VKAIEQPAGEWKEKSRDLPNVAQMTLLLGGAARRRP